MEEWRQYQYWGVLSGAPPRSGKDLGQASTAAHQFIREALEQDLPPALNRAIASLSPWPTVVIAALVVTAIGVSVLAIKAISE